jgi:hypothetical protein
MQYHFQTQCLKYIMSYHLLSKALHWLKLNHIDYYHCLISERNLASYPNEGCPVVVDYYTLSSNKDFESTSIHDMEEEDGMTEGPCPFIVHGITGEELLTKTIKTIKAIALAIEHAETPELIYGNPQLFPAILPWLFPYGLGGIGQQEHKPKLSSMMHKRHLLMYYDKWFQKDPHFPLITFNYEQMKESTTTGYLTTKKKLVDDITDRLLNVTMLSENNDIVRFFFDTSSKYKMKLHVSTFCHLSAHSINYGQPLHQW